MRTEQPLVSVCIPAYNTGRYIGKTIDSLIRQTYANIEIIISDNASTDNTREVVASFKDQKIRYYRNSSNIGGKNFNKAMGYATGNVIALYHSDDIYHPQIVEKEIALLSSSGNVGAVFTLDTLINETDTILSTGVRLPASLRKKSTYSFTEIYTTLLYVGYNFLICPTFMTTKEVLSKVGMFDTLRYGDWVGGAGDTDQWLRIAEKYDLGIVHERLIYRRVSSASGSGQYETTHINRSYHFMVLDVFMKSPALVKKLDRELIEQYEFHKFYDDVTIAKNMLRQGRNSEARTHLLHAFTWQQVSVGFRNWSNVVRLLFACALLAGTYVKAGRIVASIAGNAKAIFSRLRA